MRWTLSAVYLKINKVQKIFSKLKSNLKKKAMIGGRKKKGAFYGRSANGYSHITDHTVVYITGSLFCPFCYYM